VVAHDLAAVRTDDGLESAGDAAAIELRAHQSVVADRQRPFAEMALAEAVDQ
jgi:hypothetical protein